MNKQQKIDTIYEKIANKELSFGCRVIVETTGLCYSCSGGYDSEYTGIVYEHCTFLGDFRDGQGISESKEGDLINDLESLLHNESIGECDKIKMELFKNYSGIFHGQEIGEKGNTTYFHKIIGHPVMVGDVMDYLNFQTKFSMASLHYIIHDDLVFIIENWKDKRKPIEDQSEQCINFVYNLISE